MNNDNQIIKDDEIDLRALLEVIWSDRKLIMKVTGFVIFVGILYLLLTPSLYKSTITMYPNIEATRGFGQFQGMATMMGVDMADDVSAFNIPDIINSRTLRTKIIYKKWDTNTSRSPVDLISYWEINGDSKFLFNPLKWFSDSDGYKKNLKWESAALQKLSDRISVIEDKSGLITIGVLMEDPELSAQISNYIYEGVVELSNVNHIKTAKMNREFIQERQGEVKEILVIAEDSLKGFRSKNRKVMDSPQLQLELERLIREVEIQTQIYITLQQQYELARIEEVKEMPSVVILDLAKPAVEKDSPKFILTILISLIFGATLSLFIILFGRYFKE